MAFKSTENKTFSPCWQYMRKKGGYLGEGIGETVVIEYEKSLTYFHRSNFFYFASLQASNKTSKSGWTYTLWCTCATYLHLRKQYRIRNILPKLYYGIYKVLSIRKLEVRDQRAQILEWFVSCLYSLFRYWPIVAAGQGEKQNLMALFWEVISGVRKIFLYTSKRFPKKPYSQHSDISMFSVQH